MKNKTTVAFTWDKNFSEALARIPQGTRKNRADHTSLPNNTQTVLRMNHRSIGIEMVGQSSRMQSNQ